MKTLGRIFLSGLAALVPLVLTVWLLGWLGFKSERLLGGVIQWLLPEGWYLPGLGLLLGVGLVLAVGVLMQLYLVQRLFQLGEALLERIPLIKTLYGAISDVMRMVSSRDGERAGRPVLVRLPERGAVVGFVTRDALGAELGDADTVAVYFPMSYQLGGYTVMLPRGALEPLSMSAQDAMRFVLTAGMGAARS